MVNKETEITFVDGIEFTFPAFTVYYDDDCWKALHENEEVYDIEVIEDKENPLTESITLFDGFVFTVEMLNKLKDFLEKKK